MRSSRAYRSHLNGDSSRRFAGALAALLLVGCSEDGSVRSPPMTDTPVVTIRPAEVSPETTIDISQCAGLLDYIFEAESPVSLLSSLLNDAARMGGDVRLRAEALREAVDALEPAAEYAMEAIGRTRFSDDSELFISVMRSIVSTCALDTAKLEEAIELVQRLSPQPGGRPGSNLYGRCDSSNALIGPPMMIVPPMDQLLRCGQQAALEKVSLQTGVVSHVLPSSLSIDWHVTPDGRAIYWSSIHTYPAEGLSEPAWSATVDYLPLDGSIGYTAELVMRTPGYSHGREPFVLYASTDRVVFMQSVEMSPDNPGATQDRLTIIDSKGTEIVGYLTLDLLGERFIDNPYSYAKLLPGPLIVFNYPALAILDVATGSVLYGSTASQRDRFFTDSSCAKNQFVGYASYESGWRVFAPTSTANGTWSITEITTPWLSSEAGYGHGQLMTQAGLLQRTNDGNYVLYAFDGTQRWSIPATVARDADVVGDWVIVTNFSNEKIVVDPSTGTEAALDAAAIKTILAADIPAPSAVVPGVPQFNVGADGVQQLDLATICRS